MVLERRADEVGDICVKTEAEAPVSTRNLRPERESCKKTGKNLRQEEHELPAGQLVSLIPGARSFAVLSLIPMFAMIPAEIGGCTGGQRTYRTWSRTRSNTRSRSRLRTLSESFHRVIRTRRNRKSG